jgi:hypothetical protein
VSDNTIHTHHNEVTGLVPVGQHERQEARKFPKKKKKKRSDEPEGDVEDLLHHNELGEVDEGDENETTERDAPAPDEEDEHLDLLL